MCITTQINPVYSQGFSLCEILVSMMILALGILTVTKMQLLAIQHDEDAYCYSLAANQLQALAERMYLGSLPNTAELQQWNKDNTDALPQASGQIKGQGTHTLVLSWLERKKQIHYQSTLIVPRGY